MFRVRCFEFDVSRFRGWETRFAKSVGEVDSHFGCFEVSRFRGFEVSSSMFEFDVSSSMFRVRCFEVSRFGNAFREKCRGRRPWVSRNWKNGFERSGPSGKRASRLSVVDVSMFRRFEVDRDHYTERFRSRSFRVPGTLGEEQLSREAPQDVTTLVPYMRGART